MDDFEKYLREADLEALENFKKGMGSAPVIYKAGFVKPSEPGAPMIFVASEETEDRLGDIISAGGWALDAYKQNPVYMWAHDHTIAPLGTAKVWIEGKQLLNMVNWDEADELARFIRGKFERRVLRAESVGFRPTEFEANGATGGIHFTKQELLEISAVPIPAHPKALAKAMGGRRFSIVVPELVKTPKGLVDDLLEGILEQVDEEGNKLEKPFPNEHACRLKPPESFQPDSFKRMERDHEGKKYSVIMGRLKDETTMTEQAYRYPKDTWESGEAKSHCESHDGSFEAASGEEALKEEKQEDMGAMMDEAMGHIEEAMAMMGKMREGMKGLPIPAEQVDNEDGVLKEARELVEQLGKELRGG